MNRTLAAFAVVASASYLFLGRTLAFPGGAILKTSMCVLLAAVALRSGKTLLAVALVFSAIGDALLAIDGAMLFVPALASFLMTHVLYATIFVRINGETPFPIPRWRKVVSLVAVLFAIGYTVVLWPHLGVLAVPVVVYISAIVAMAVLSVRVQPVIVCVGALLFMTSDSLIAYEKFLHSASWLGPAIWITYAMAQLAITYGLTRSTPIAVPMTG